MGADEGELQQRVSSAQCASTLTLGPCPREHRRSLPAGTLRACAHPALPVGTPRACAHPALPALCPRGPVLTRPCPVPCPLPPSGCDTRRWTVPRSTVLGVAKRGARWPSGAQGEEPCSVAPGRPDELESFRGRAGPVAPRSPLPRVPVLTRLLGGHDAPLPPVMLEMEEGPF